MLSSDETRVRDSLRAAHRANPEERMPLRNGLPTRILNRKSQGNSLEQKQMHLLIAYEFSTEKN